MGQRTWIKIYCDKWLTGSLKEEDIELRGVWISLLALAGNLTFGHSGLISLPNGIGLPDVTISDILCIPEDVWLRAKARLGKTKRIAVQKNNVIKILNWKKYQSEYSRQKTYRKKTVTQSDQPEIEEERDIEREEEGQNKKFHHLLQGFQFFEKEKTIPRQLIENLAEKYGTQKVLDELFSANNWLLANPKRKKNNLGQFISNWFKKVEPLPSTLQVDPADYITCQDGHTYNISNDECPECRENDMMDNISDLTKSSDGVRTIIHELAKKKGIPDV
jgi:hypothetical protein